MKMTDFLLGADKTIPVQSHVDDRAEALRRRGQIGGDPIFHVESVTVHRGGYPTVRLRCTWVSTRGFELIDHDEECELPGMGVLAHCVPGDTFRLVRTDP
jgi:hypothetical protein